MIVPKNLGEIAKGAARIVRGQLAGLPVTLDIVWVEQLNPGLPAQVRLARKIAGQKKAIAVFWADLSLPDQIFLYLAEPGGGRILVRNVASEAAGPAARLLAMAVIVQSSVSALLGGARIGLRPPRRAPKVPAPPPAKKKPAVRKPPVGKPARLTVRLRRFGLAVAYGLYTYARRAPVVHAAHLRVLFRVFRWFSVSVAYRVQPQTEVERDPIELEVNRHPIELEAAFAYGLARWEFGGGVGLLVDYTTWSARSNDLGVVPRSPGSRWLVAAMAQGSVAFALTSFSALVFRAGIEVPLNETRFTVVQGSNGTAVASPWPVRPFFLIGARVDVY
jgi:hypothetical protein